MCVQGTEVMKYRSNPNNSTGTLSPEALGTFSKITQMASGRSQLLLATNTSQVLTLTSKFTDRILHVDVSKK